MRLGRKQPDDELPYLPLGPLRRMDCDEGRWLDALLDSAEIMHVVPGSLMQADYWLRGRGWVVVHFALHDAGDDTGLELWMIITPAANALIPGAGSGDFMAWTSPQMTEAIGHRVLALLLREGFYASLGASPDPERIAGYACDPFSPGPGHAGGLDAGRLSMLASALVGVHEVGRNTRGRPPRLFQGPTR